MQFHQNKEEESLSAPLGPMGLPLAEEEALQARVTAKEFAQAVASLETRKEQSERALQETVPLGEVLQQLGVATGAEEILAEVQALRAQQDQEQQAVQQRAQRRRHGYRVGLGLAAASLLGLVCVASVSVLRSPAPAMVAVAPPAAEVRTVTVVSPQPQPVELRTLAEVPEGQLFRYKDEEFQTLLHNPTLPPSQVIVQTLGASSTSGWWTLVKHDGHIYMHGYMAAMSPQAMAQMKNVQIFSGRFDSSVAGGLAYVKPVTVRVGTFKWQGTDNKAGIPYITVSDLHLDQYAHEHPDL